MSNGLLARIAAAVSRQATGVGLSAPNYLANARRNEAARPALPQRLAAKRAAARPAPQPALRQHLQGSAMNAAGRRSAQPPPKVLPLPPAGLPLTQCISREMGPSGGKSKHDALRWANQSRSVGPAGAWCRLRNKDAASASASAEMCGKSSEAASARRIV
jgi:hypothetical protein